MINRGLEPSLRFSFIITCMQKYNFLKYFREPVNALTHLGTALAAVPGLIVLMIAGWGATGKVVSLAIYGASLVSLFAASGVYHMAQAGPKVMLTLRKLDHSAIYLLIAGTYTPICYHFFDGFWRWGMLAVIWSLALVGVLVKLFVIKAPRWVTAGVYLAMGWLCLAAVGEMLRSMPPGALAWLVAGGLAYTLGAVIYITKKMNFKPGVFGFHEVWHIFVILGALAHYISVLVYVALG